MFHTTVLRPANILGLAMCLTIAGCEPETLGFTEVKRIHEVVTPAEWATFVRIVEQLPDRRVPPFPSVFSPAPQWDAGRTALVRELYAEELANREIGWKTGPLGELFERHRVLTRELRKEKLTAEQFAGLVLTLGAALCRNEVPEGIDLANLSERARPFISELAVDDQPFNRLNPETSYAVLRKAMWVARKVRTDKLKQVPPENQDLARKHYDWLVHALPAEFLYNPVDEIHDLLEEQGLPFEELPDSGSDEDLMFPPTANAAPRQGY